MTQFTVVLLRLQLGKGDYNPEPELQAEAVHRNFNAICTLDACYKMGTTCRNELATDGNGERDTFCRSWCCALLVASGRSGLTGSATTLRAKDDVPMVIIGSDGGCKSLTDSTSDEWCTTTCQGGIARQNPHLRLCPS